MCSRPGASRSQGPAHELHDNEHVQAGLSRWLKTWSVKSCSAPAGAKPTSPGRGARSGRSRPWRRTITRGRSEEAGQALSSRAPSSSRSTRALARASPISARACNLSGDSGGDGAALLARRLQVWRGADPWIARMDAPRVARSSLFHMRMELRHRDTYRARWQERWRRDRRRGEGAARSLDAARGADLASRCRRGLCRAGAASVPAMLNDTRKLMAAAFLLLAPPAPVILIRPAVSGARHRAWPCARRSSP